MTAPGWDAEADHVVVGSGAAGATAAAVLAEGGREVLVLEEGPWKRREDFREDLHGALLGLFRDYGTQAARGRSLIPLLEGRCVGGSTVVNGAVLHRLPEEVHAAWAAVDPGLAARIPFSSLERCAEAIEKDLGVRENLGGILPGLPAAAALQRMGWQARAMARGAPGCRSTGRCLQGCPSGGKLSMEASYLPRAQRAGARILDRHRVERLLRQGPRVLGALARDARGRRLRIRARRSLVLAAGAIQTPALLARSSLGSPLLGRHFQCHLGAGLIGLLEREASAVTGPPQGIEVDFPDARGLRLATQLLPPELLLARSGLQGRPLAELMGQASRLSAWTASVRSGAEGKVGVSWSGSLHVRFEPSSKDLERVREGMALQADLLFELGARAVYPGVAGLPNRLEDPAQAAMLRRAPLDPRAYPIAVGHLFGTCRMSFDPARGVVDPGFRLHGTEGIHVVDASVFPSNIGVNPQLAIQSLAMHAARGLLGED